jgi:hypothetical protein
MRLTILTAMTVSLGATAQAETPTIDQVKSAMAMFTGGATEPQAYRNGYREHALDGIDGKWALSSVDSLPMPTSPVGWPATASRRHGGFNGSPSTRSPSAICTGPTGR